MTKSVHRRVNFGIYFSQRPRSASYETPYDSAAEPQPHTYHAPACPLSWGLDLLRRCRCSLIPIADIADTLPDVQFIFYRIHTFFAASLGFIIVDCHCGSKKSLSFRKLLVISFFL